MTKQISGRETAARRRTWTWAVPVLVFLLFIIGQLLVLVPVKLLGLATRETIETYPTVLYLILGSFTVSGALFVLWVRCFERRSLAGAGLAVGSRTLRDYAVGFALGLLMAAGIVFTVRLLGGYRTEITASFVGADMVPILILLVAFGIQSLTEEFAFRGWMLGRIAERFGATAGVIGNSLLFTLMHVGADTFGAGDVLSAMIFFAGMMLFSVFASLLALRHRTVWAAAAWHTAWNWLFITGFGLPTTGIDLGLAPIIADYALVPGAATWLTGGSEGPEGSVLMPIVLALGCLAAMSVGRLRRAAPVAS